VDWEASLQVLPPFSSQYQIRSFCCTGSSLCFYNSGYDKKRVSERARETAREREIGATAAAADFSYWYGMAAERRRGGGGAADTRTRDGLQQQEEEQRCVALQLPCDMSRRIFSQLDCRDLMHCSLVCKQWCNESAELREGWREECWAEKSVRGLLVNRDNKRARPLYDAYFAGSPD